MRRAAPTGPLSPRLIKHFAVTTVVLTGLLALFASGEQWGARAQIGAVEAHNQLLKTEAEQVGTRRLAAKLIVSPGPARRGFDDDPGIDFGERGSIGAPQAAPDQTMRAFGDHGAPSPELSQTPDVTPVITSGSSPTTDPLVKNATARVRSAPTAQEIADITANSARRSGQAGAAD